MRSKGRVDAGGVLPLGEQLPAVGLPHFPTRWQAVVWRNWGLLTASRIARALGCAESEVGAAAAALGLGEAASPEMEARWLRRGYITLIRQNWHLLPYAQLLKLLGWTAEQMAYTLKEDDFLWAKLGAYKPRCERVQWAPLTAGQARRTREIRRLVSESFPEAHQPPAERPFDFLDHYGREAAPRRGAKRSPFKLRLAYSYSALYGDPLLDPEVDPFPEGLLHDLSANGVNAVWLQGVLYTLVPWFGRTAWSRGCERRIRNLNALVAKAARHGVGVYLYLNEPRGMPAEFFKAHPHWRGPLYRTTGLYGMCVSEPEVLERLQRGAGELFKKVPGLAGVFTITMSENMTHCCSKATETPCPRCAERNVGEIVASVNNAIAAGVHAVKPKADVIAWSWSWREEWWPRAVDALRPGLRVMHVSENYLSVEYMGVKGRVSDYTISQPGPARLAKQMWQRASERGLGTVAKVQLNNTWECSAVPYLPVPFLVKRHLKNLETRGVGGLMVSWTLGGYPGGNLRLIDSEPEALAREMFGAAAAPGIVKAWRRFSRAFREFPLHGTATLYTGPQNYGPMNLLFARPTGRRATMLGFPYDDLETWRGRGHFPPEVFEAQFRKLSEGWREGLALLQGASGRVPAGKRAHFDDLFSVASAAYAHFRSTYLQIRFIGLRDGADQGLFRREAPGLLGDEMELAAGLLEIARRDSRIGFEATNHYYYTVNSLMEKVVNCAYLHRSLRVQGS